MIKLCLFLLIVLGAPLLVHSQSPGNVSGSLRWWLKSGVGTYVTGTTAATAGQAVATWDDQSTIANDAINGTAGTRPIYRAAIINGYPALEFDGTKFLDASAVPGIGPTQNFYLFMVFKQNSYQTNGLMSDGEGTFIIDRRDVTNNLTSFKVVNTDKYAYQRRQDDNNNLGGPISTTPVNTTSFVIVDYFRDLGAATEGIYLNGATEISQTGLTAGITGPLLKIGRHATNANGGLNGYFTEIALYSTTVAPNVTLSAAERARIESYFAIKYGITLSATISYLKADGTTIYPSTGTHSGYVNDIAGIGQDNNSGLLQTSSRSQNANFVVTASGASNLSDGEFFVWGSNNGSLTTPSSSVDGVTIKRRLSRVWRLAETGDVGTLTITFDLSGVPGPKVGADLRLLIDRDGDGFADNDRTPVTGTLTGSTFSVTTSAANILDNNDYFTIGTVNTTTTPLPVELTDFTVTYEKPEVIASWETASELNNDYFTLERAGEDLSFDDIARVPGSGTTKEPQRYSAIDPNPFEGKSYYRLKQTDYDGAFTYSSPRYIFIESSSNRLSVYPNPGDGRMLNLRFGNTPFQLKEVTVFDQKGRSLEQVSISETNLDHYALELTQRLATGLYLLKVRYNGKEEFLKLAIN